MARSLGLFAGVSANIWTGQVNGEHDSRPRGAQSGPGGFPLGLAFLDGPRPAKPRRGWAPVRCASGAQVLLHGTLDNADALAAELGLQGASPERTYGEAVARWGDAADDRMIGHYAALVAGPDGLRLARSPWSAPSLAYANNGSRALVATNYPTLIAGGLPAELDHAVLAAMVSGATERDERGWYRDAFQVPHGSVVHLSPAGSRVVRWYDPAAIRPVRFARDEDYVEAARETLAGAVRAALAATARPGIALSGGLDSALVAAELLRQLPPGRTLPSFTFTPHPDWDGASPPGTFGDERGAVEAFAAMHPALRPHFPSDSDAGFDEAALPFARALGGFHRHIHLAAPYQGVWRAARDARCDMLITADWGNQTISSDAPWAPVEFLRRGQWQQLVLMMRNRRGDSRPLWRRIASRAVLPNLPRGLRNRVRALVHGIEGHGASLMRLVRPEMMERFGVGERARSDLPIGWSEIPRSREEFVHCLFHWTRVDSGETMTAYEQIYGLRHRDVTAWRPLVELCLGMPAGQFIRDGEDRYLARRMGIGRMPEAQRTNRLYGRHHADWHARLTPRRAELQERVRRLAEHPWLGEWFDTDRMMALIEDWPEQNTFDDAVEVPRRYALPLALNAAEFVDWLEGRNG